MNAVPQTGSFDLTPHNGHWVGKWITPPDSSFEIPAGKRPAHELFTTFTLDEIPPHATLFATAAGIYEAFLNGHRVGDQELTPGSTSYDETLYYQEYPVADFLRQGENELLLVLSDGWYWGQVGAHRSEGKWGNALGVLAELHLHNGSDNTTIIATNEAWRSRPSQIIRASLMEGQTTDFRIQGIPSEVLVDKVAAPTPTRSPAPPVKVCLNIKPKSVVQTGPDQWVMDFGQNASGWIRLADLGPLGTRTTLEYGEYADGNGELQTSHLDSMHPREGLTSRFVQLDEVISDGITKEFEPRHTVHGFQYIRVTRQGYPFDPGSIEMRVVHTDFDAAGSFECSNSDLNRLYEMTRWSFLGNAVDVPTDCPTRERLGWTGDYQVFAPTATRLFDVLGFSRKWLQSVRDDQLPDGRIASYSPDHHRVKGDLEQQMATMTGAAGWGDAIVYVPWQMYRAYGDLTVLAENFDAMRRWVGWAADVAATRRHASRIERSPEPSPHEQFLWDGSFHWGEWLEPKTRLADGRRVSDMEADPRAWFTADKSEVATAYLYLSAKRLAKIADLLSDEFAAERYANLSRSVLEAWRTEYLSSSGRTVSDTQASYVRAFAFGLIPEPMKPLAVARLVELIRDADTHLRTGFLSTAYLLPVLADNGEADLAYELLFRRTPPSWMYMVDRGATTIWEDWEGITDDGAHESLNHYAKGSVSEFLLTHVLGLRQAPESSGWERCVVKPVLTPLVTWAHGTQKTPYGLISVSWRVECGQLICDVKVPNGVVAEIELPGAESIEVTGRREVTSIDVP